MHYDRVKVTLYLYFQNFSHQKSFVFAYFFSATFVTLNLQHQVYFVFIKGDHSNSQSPHESNVNPVLYGSFSLFSLSTNQKFDITRSFWIRFVANPVTSYSWFILPSWFQMSCMLRNPVILSLEI